MSTPLASPETGTRGGTAAGVAPAVVCLALACALVAAAALAAPAFAQEDVPIETRTLIKSTHSRLVFEKSFERVAVGDVDVLAYETISSREILLQGVEVGRTSLLVWFTDGTVRDFLVTVERDLSALAAILQRIHPGIEVDMAPDRDAVILSGVVPDISYSRAAEAAARSYLEAGGRRSKGAALPLIRKQGEEAPSREAPPAGEEAIRVKSGDLGTSSGQVINLLQLEKLPPRPEERLEEALRAVGGAGVTVRRVVRGEIPDDDKDMFVLEGQVADQVVLARVLSLANGIISGESATQKAIEVLADESGALVSQGGGASGAAAGGSLGAGGGLGGGTSASSGGSSSIAQALYNQVEQNIGRAKVVELADGRIISFIRVEHIPQVRVDVRICEINRSKLFDFTSNLNVLLSDFNQPSLNPAGVASLVQGDGAVRVGSVSAVDIQNVISALAGSLTNQFQVSGDHYAVDATLNLLESNGVSRTLSRPSLAVLSGELAYFSVGGEIPIPQNTFTDVPTGGGGGQTATSVILSETVFRSFGIELGVRPLVGEDGEIVVDLVPSVSFPDPQLTAQIRASSGADLQSTAFETRVLRTSARLQDGETLMVGGLISRSSTRDTSATPWFGDIPVIGWLFRSRKTSNEDLDLVIIVNPTIVRDPIPQASLWVYPDTMDLFHGLPRGQGEGQG